MKHPCILGETPLQEAPDPCAVFNTDPFDNHLLDNPGEGERSMVSKRMRLVAAAVCGIAAFASCLLYGRQVRREAERMRLDALERYGGEVVSLLVATRTLENGDIIDASSVASRDWLADLAPDQAVVRLEDVVGREVTVPLAKGLPLTQLNFRDGTSGIDVPSGYVALSLPLNDKLGLSRNVSAGTRVVAYAVGSNGTVMLTSMALVLASPVESATFSQTQTISLAVHPEDVAAVLGASARGDLRLVVPADDVELSEAPAAAAPTDVPEEPVGETAPDDNGPARSQQEADAASAEDAPVESEE